ncbi:cytochrome c maturation protein CcmE [Chloroflexota bacterium]
MRRKKFLIGGIILFLAIAYLSYISFQNSATYYYTVSELVEQIGTIQSKNVRIAGQVATGSVEKEPGSFALSFNITDGKNSLPVVYNGTVPDTFTVNREVVVEGHLNSESVFQAKTILTKCPSKYVPEQ